MRRLLLLLLFVLPAGMVGAQERTAVAPPGGVVQLTLTSATPPDRVMTKLFGREIVFYPNQDGTIWHALIGIDLDTKPGDYVVVIDAVRAGERVPTAPQTLRVVPKKYPTRRLRVAARYVNPPASDLARIQRDTARLNTVFRAFTPQRRWDGPFLAPVDGKPTSSFGLRSIFNGQPRNPHAGADFQSPAGVPVRAPNAGEILLAEDLYFTGNTVVMDHGLGLFSLFAHLSTLAVTEGQIVPQGATVGAVGATGRVTGPHLHWAVRLNGARVDPLSLMAVLESDQHAEP